MLVLIKYQSPHDYIGIPIREFAPFLLFYEKHDLHENLIRAAWHNYHPRTLSLVQPHHSQALHPRRLRGANLSGRTLLHSLYHSVKSEGISGVARLQLGVVWLK